MRYLDYLKIDSIVELKNNKNKYVVIEICGFVDMCSMGIALVKCDSRNPHSRPNITFVKWLYGNEIQDRIYKIIE